MPNQEGTNDLHCSRWFQLIEIILLLVFFPELEFFKRCLREASSFIFDCHFIHNCFSNRLTIVQVHYACTIYSGLEECSVDGEFKSCRISGVISKDVLNIRSIKITGDRKYQGMVVCFQQESTGRIFPHQD